MKNLFQNQSDIKKVVIVSFSLSFLGVTIYHFTIPETTATLMSYVFLFGVVLVIGYYLIIHLFDSAVKKVKNRNQGVKDE